MRTALACLLLWTAVAAAKKPAAAKVDKKPPAAKPDKTADLVELGYETTPGKPMELAKPGEAAEKVVARKHGDKIELEVARNVGKSYETGKAQLSLGDWRALLAIVATQHLRGWKPAYDKSAVGVADYSSSGFWVKGTTENRQHWDRPISNGAAPGALAGKLGELAKAKVPTPRLFYFGF